MKKTEIQPGFLQAYRMFVTTRIVFWVIIGPILIVLQLASSQTGALVELPSMSLIERLTLPNLTPILLIEVILLILLFMPQAARRLGRAYVPMVLLIGLGPLLVGYYWWPSENPLQTPFVIFFFVMVVLIAWQYPFRYIIAYVAGLSLYQFWLSSPDVFTRLSVDGGWLILQAATMLIVGYVIVQLASIQREQRAALAQAYEQQAAVNARLQRYAAAVEQLTIIRERNRMARELHDTLAHSLSAVTVQLEAVRSLWSVDAKAAHRMLDQADQVARRGLTEARRSLQDLRATPLQDLGLVAALRELAETAAERSGASLELHLPGRIAGSLPPAVEQGVYRIAQETLENVVRHAQAGSLLVRLERDGSRLALTIEDDGLGTDLDAESAPPEDQLGIRGMQERASLIEGELHITSQPGQGTSVHLTVPL